jgi:hypothetical protein
MGSLLLSLHVKSLLGILVKTRLTIKAREEYQVQQAYLSTHMTTWISRYL